MIISFPRHLPYPTIEGYTIKPDEAIVRTEMEAGPARQRLRYTQTPSKITVKWIMNRNQFSLFEAWYKYYAKEGAEWFLISLLGGFGQSSRLSIQYAKKFNSDLVIYEDSAEWADFFAKSCPEAGQYIKFMEAENQEVRPGVTSLIYKDFKASLLNKKFDFVMVDAPKGSSHCSRYQLLDVAEHLKDSFVVLLDDCGRDGEKETWQYFKQKLQDLKIDFVEKMYSSDKTVAMICSPDWAFLTTL